MIIAVGVLSSFVLPPVLVAALVLTAFSVSGGTARGRDQEAHTPRPPEPRRSEPSSKSSSPGTALPPGPGRSDEHAALARQLYYRDLQVWFEIDLVAAWLDGAGPFHEAVRRLGSLARLPGVAGLKIADELGHGDGLRTSAQARQFLAASRAALAQVAPGREILVGAVVPELGSLTWTGPERAEAARELRSSYPAATISAMTGYLKAGLIDRLSLSTDLLSAETYRDWGTSVDQAQLQAWAHVRSLGWASDARLQARQPMAEPGGFQGSAAQASSDIRTYVTIPLSSGAAAVDIWTWREPYDGETVSLLNDALQSNPLWHGLMWQRRGGAELFTHMTPVVMPDGASARAQECDKVAEVFSAVIVAAGKG